MLLIQTHLLKNQMIKVLIKKRQSNILSIKVTGHANSAEYGRDLVCAGVSTVGIGILNTLDKKGYLTSSIDYEMNEGFMNIEVTDWNKEIQLILETFEISLMTIEESYPDYIKIRRMEE